ncbi:LysR family transcriptional regulator [Pseudomonas entomophila]|jgi:DNA-binding transcriptional LysR family regulator|uniref:LysR family transcriptional regulator n=1 Tax=Pseudomonas entomophila TaxID=312306 RepID=UPI0015E42F33|nr:LysR family transcriptional regulator [Pseudomonas entomophila]MBA1191561.1 LysR family transcriptional regulator [Pseudomonas entomophila]
MAHDLPPLNALKAFEAAARLNSVSQAAESLHVTHGAVSRQIKLLEEHLGVALFRKEGRGLKLTDAGGRLFEASGEAFDRLRQVCAELGQTQDQAPFVLGCSGSLLARWFIPRLGRLEAELPDLRLHLSAGDGDADPRRTGLDAWLVFAEPPWPSDMQVHMLAQERIGPVMSPYVQGSELLRQAPAERLLEERLLQTRSRPQAWPTWARQQHLDPARLTFGQDFEHLYYLLEAALAGLGVAIAPEPLVADDLRSGRLVAPWGFTPTTAVLSLWVPRRANDRRAERLAQWLRAELERRVD